MGRLPRVYIKSGASYISKESITIAGGLSNAKSFGYFSIWKYLYLYIAKRRWRNVKEAEWQFKRIHHVTSTVNVKGGGMKV